MTIIQVEQTETQVFKGRVDVSALNSTLYVGQALASLARVFASALCRYRGLKRDKEAMILESIGSAFNKDLSKPEPSESTMRIRATRRGGRQHED